MAQDDDPGPAKWPASHSWQSSVSPAEYRPGLHRSHPEKSLFGTLPTAQVMQDDEPGVAMNPGSQAVQEVDASVSANRPTGIRDAADKDERQALSAVSKDIHLRNLYTRN